jgi:hypothetical protein
VPPGWGYNWASLSLGAWSSRLGLDTLLAKILLSRNPNKPKLDEIGKNLLRKAVSSKNCFANVAYTHARAHTHTSHTHTHTLCFISARPVVVVIELCTRSFGPYSNKLSCFNMFYGCKSCIKSRTSEKSFVSLYRVYSASIGNILKCIYEL